MGYIEVFIFFFDFNECNKIFYVYKCEIDI